MNTLEHAYTHHTHKYADNLEAWFGSKETALRRLHTQVLADVNEMLADGNQFPPQLEIPFFYDRDNLVQ